MLVSGPYGSTGLDGVDSGECYPLLRAAGRLLAQRTGADSALLLKDVWESSDNPRVPSRFHPLPVDPSMTFDIGDFADMGAYLDRLNSKYRVRYRRARKQFAGLTRKMLSTGEVTALLPELYELYLETSGGANIQLVQLRPEYFEWLRDRADVCAYHDGGKLVGFTTGVYHRERYFAHFLGMREKYKFSHHLYHNMLFDLLEQALGRGCTVLDYGRTAPEIKSSIGARPQNYATFVRADSALLNALMPCFIPAVYRSEPWQARHPFR